MQQNIVCTKLSEWVGHMHYIRMSALVNILVWITYIRFARSANNYTRIYTLISNSCNNDSLTLVKYCNVLLLYKLNIHHQHQTKVTYGMAESTGKETKNNFLKILHWNLKKNPFSGIVLSENKDFGLIFFKKMSH